MPGATLAGRVSHAGRPLFDTLQMELRAGCWTCLLGSSGVGKTTLLRLFADLDTGGEFDGSITTSDGAPMQGRACYMAQSDLLAPWLSLRDNVLLGARLRGEKPANARADELIQQMGLSAHALKRPAELSGGMRQRAALARTLIEDRPFVLLDEPFSALDARTRAEMQELAFASLAGRTVLLVTHDPAEAVRLGQYIYLMTESGLADCKVPSGAPIRAIDDPETVAAQTVLLQQLRRIATPL